MKENSNDREIARRLASAMRSRRRNRRTLTVPNAIRMLEESGGRFSRRQVSAFLMSCERNGYGRFIKGSRSSPSRLRWTNRSGFIDAVKAQYGHHAIGAFGLGRRSEDDESLQTHMSNGTGPSDTKSETINSPSALIIAVTRWCDMLRSNEINGTSFVNGLDGILEKMHLMIRSSNFAMNPEYGMLADDIIAELRQRHERSGDQ